MESTSPSRILVSRWAKKVFGDYAPTAYALRCWIEKGKIHPAPLKVRGKWFVLPNAVYRDPASNQQL